MTNKIVAIQGNHPSTLNPISDTSIFLAVEAQNRKYKIFYYEPKDLSIIKNFIFFFLSFYSKKYAGITFWIKC